MILRHVSYGQYDCKAHSACILYKNVRGGHDIIPISNPMRTDAMALIAIVLTVARTGALGSLEV